MRGIHDVTAVLIIVLNVESGVGQPSAAGDGIWQPCDGTSGDPNVRLIGGVLPGQKWALRGKAKILPRK